MSARAATSAHMGRYRHLKPDDATLETLWHACNAVPRVPRVVLQVSEWGPCSTLVSGTRITVGTLGIPLAKVDCSVASEGDIGPALVARGVPHSHHVLVCNHSPGASGPIEDGASEEVELLW